MGRLRLTETELQTEVLGIRIFFGKLLHGDSDVQPRLRTTETDNLSYMALLEAS